MDVEMGFRERLEKWEADGDRFSIPSFVVSQVDEQQPQLKWFDKGVKERPGENGITKEHRMRVINRITQLYKKITPSNTLLAHQLADEEEDELFKANRASLVYYDNACLHRCKDLLTHSTICQELAAVGIN
jgi:hypothetical protein